MRIRLHAPVAGCQLSGLTDSYATPLSRLQPDQFADLPGGHHPLRRGAAAADPVMEDVHDLNPGNASGAALGGLLIHLLPDLPVVALAGVATCVPGLVLLLDRYRKARLVTACAITDEPESAMKIWILAELHAQPQHRDVLLSALHKMVIASRDEPGCLRYDLLVDSGDSCRFSLIECYSDELALELHRDSDHYRQYRGQSAGWLAGPPRVQELQALDVLD